MRTELGLEIVIGQLSDPPEPEHILLVANAIDVDTLVEVGALDTSAAFPLIVAAAE